MCHGWQFWRAPSARQEVKGLWRVRRKAGAGETMLCGGSASLALRACSVRLANACICRPRKRRDGERSSQELLAAAPGRRLREPRRTVCTDPRSPSRRHGCPCHFARERKSAINIKAERRSTNATGGATADAPQRSAPARRAAHGGRREPATARPARRRPGPRTGR